MQVLGDPPALALLGLDDRAPGVPAFGLQALDHAHKGRPEPSHLGAVDPQRGGVIPSRLQEVQALHGRDQVIQGSEATVQEQPVAEQRGHQGEPQQDHFAPPSQAAQPPLRGHHANEHGGCDQQQVDEQNLDEERT